MRKKNGRRSELFSKSTIFRCFSAEVYTGNQFSCKEMKIINTATIRLAITVISVILITTGFASSQAAQSSTQASQSVAKTPDSVVDWIRTQAVPLKTIEPGKPNQDLEPFGKMVADARIVSLGEGTHGTSEHFRIKHRLIRYLVENKNFNVIGLEANFTAVLALNNYILRGEGTAEEALYSLGSWVWDTEEVLELIRWMRRYNEDPKNNRKISIYGFDLLNLYPALEGALAFVEKNDSAGASRLKQPFGSLIPIDITGANRIQSSQDDLFNKLSPEKADLLVAAVEQILDYYDQNRAELVKRTSAGEWATARQHGVIALQRARQVAHVNRWFSLLGQNEEIALQQRAASGASALLSFFEKHDPVFAEKAKPLLTGIRQPRLVNRYRSELTFNDRAEWDSLAAQTIARLQIRRAQYVAASSETIWTEMMKHAADISRLLIAYRDYLAKPNQWWTDLRDPHMAENVAWILEQSGRDSKIILWAHNAHISHQPNNPGIGPLGNELERRFGDAHLSVGLFLTGEFFKPPFTHLRRRMTQIRAFARLKSARRKKGQSKTSLR